MTFPFTPAASNPSAYSRHLERASSYIRFYGGAPPTPPTFRSERSILEQNHHFIRDIGPQEFDEFDEEKDLAKRYYENLFREYALVDLSHWREKKVALRWRTKSEVLAGTGQFNCGCLSCSEGKHGRKEKELSEFELDFRYEENGLKKNSLVKVYVCRRCARKLKKAQKSGGHDKERSPTWKKRRPSTGVDLSEM